MLTAKELMHPRYKCLIPFTALDHKTQEWFEMKKGEIQCIPDNFLVSVSPTYFKKLEWWECREPEDMPNYIIEKERQPYNEKRKRYKVMYSFADIQRSQTAVTELDGGDVKYVPLRNYLPIDTPAGTTFNYEEGTARFNETYGGSAQGKTAWVNRLTDANQYPVSDKTIRYGYMPSGTLHLPDEYIKAVQGATADLENSMKNTIENFKKFKPVVIAEPKPSFLERLKQFNEKRCPLLNFPACKIRPQIIMLNISSATGELSTKLLSHKAVNDFKPHTGDIADSIGDVAILLDALAQRFGLSFEQCIQIRYNRLLLKQGSKETL